jgi:FHA domain
MTDNIGDQTPEFPINEQLLEEATHAKEEWRVIKDRLIKIEEHRDNVSDAVHSRVKTDYESRLTEAKALLLSKKTEIDGELKALYGTRENISAQLAEHRHALEEIQFRNNLGEFSEEEYQNAAREEQEKISKFETIIQSVESNIARYETIFEGEDDLFAAEEIQTPAEEVSEVVDISEATAVPHEAEPVTDADGYLVEDNGPDYFSAATDAQGTSPAIVDGNTESQRIEPKVGDENQRAHVVMIAGSNAGASYPIKGTLSFGRAESNGVSLQDAKVSRQHAQIQQQGSEYVLVDLNSSNGTYANGQRIEEHVLSNGDEIQIGDMILQFQN